MLKGTYDRTYLAQYSGSRNIRAYCTAKMRGILVRSVGGHGESRRSASGADEKAHRRFRQPGALDIEDRHVSGLRAPRNAALRGRLPPPRAGYAAQPSAIVRLPPNEPRTSRSIVRRFEAQRIAADAVADHPCESRFSTPKLRLVYTPGMIGAGVHRSPAAPRAETRRRSMLRPGGGAGCASPPSMRAEGRRRVARVGASQRSPAAGARNRRCSAPVWEHTSTRRTRS